jgi:hypothetical protein
MCRGVARESGTCSQHCATLCAYCACIKTAHKLRYLYIYWTVILCGSLLVGMVFAWARCDVEGCVVVFVVRLVAQ